MKIPMSSPDITDAERDAVAAVLRTPRLSMGSQVEAFEAAIAEYVGTQYALAVSSGTAALHLCVRAANIGADDYVITTPFSFIASANVMLYERATPIFVDVEPTSANLDADLVRAAAEDLVAGKDRWLPRTGAAPGTLRSILAVDIFGQPANYASLERTAEQFGLSLIEDASEALGAKYDGRAAGTFGDAAAFAFYPNKQLTTGEGGMVVTDRADWAERIAALRNQGRAASDSWLRHTYPGYNYRMDEMSAAMGRAQSDRLEQLLKKRAQVAGWYQEALSGADGVELPQLSPTTSQMSWFVYVVRLDAALDRQRVISELAERDIPSRAYFEPIHLQPYMAERFGYRPGDFPVAEDLASRSLALPFSGVMTREQVALVAETLKRAISSS